MFNMYEWLNREKSRYYKITVERDGSNNIVINHNWGGCYSNRGGKKNLFVHTEEEAKLIIEKMIKRRKYRGYELITSIV
jgi:WGR domain-containing protein